MIDVAQSAWERHREQERKARLQRENIEYREQLARDRAASVQAARDERSAENIIAAARTEAQRIVDRGVKDAEAAVATVAKDAAQKERSILGAPITRHTGATKKNPKAITVLHWKAVLPKDSGLSATRAPDGFGPLLFLGPGGGIPADLLAPRALVKRFPQLRNNAAFAKWAKELVPLLAETEKRYPVLARLRDDRWFARFAEHTGIAVKEEPRTESMRGVYGDVERKITVIDIPTLAGVSIDQSGLILTYAHRPGDTPEKWSKHLAELRAAFKAEGVNADRLRITEDDDARIRLVFDDAPSVFPPAIAPEPPERAAGSVAEAIDGYRTARWVLGVDARDNVIDAPMKSFPHALVVGGTGGGKSVWARTMLEALRVRGWMLFIGDGKGSDYVSLAGLPNVAMVSPNADPAQHVVLVHRVRVEVDRRFERAAAAKREGKSDTAFNYPPIIMLLDEFAIMRNRIKELGGKDKEAVFADDVETILRLGREVRVHAALCSQDLYVDTIDGSWQDNLHMVVSLGAPTSRTMMSDAFPEALRPIVQRIGDRISKGTPGRGIFVDREHRRVVEFQSFFGWSPGSTTLKQAPTPEVRSRWERWIPVSESAPRLYPRVGIKADGPDWRSGSLADIASTPTVALDGADGPLPDRAIYDPWGDEWVGARAAVDTSGHDDLDLTAVSEQTVEPKPRRTEPKPEPAPAAKPTAQAAKPTAQAAKPKPLDIDRLNDEERDELIAKLLRARVGEDTTADESEENDVTDKPEPMTEETPRDKPESDSQPVQEQPARSGGFLPTEGDFA